MIIICDTDQVEFAVQQLAAVSCEHLPILDITLAALRCQEFKQWAGWEVHALVVLYTGTSMVAPDCFKENWTRCVIMSCQSQYNSWSSILMHYSHN